MEKYLFIFYFAIKICKSIWSCLYVIPKLGQENQLTPFSIDEVKSRKKSDTLFILGGGGSINELTPHQWATIKACDSMGINFWFIHPNKPDFMMIEGFRTQDIGSARYAFFYTSIQALAKKYAGIMFFIKDIDLLEFELDKFPETILNNARAIPKISIPGSSNATVRRSIELIKSLNLKVFKETPLSSRASISFAISFGRVMGYKHIILCGVDLDNSKYFWEDSDFIPSSEVGIPESTGQNKGKIHSTVDPSVNKLLIDKVIYDMQDLLLNEDGIKLYVSSRSSKLYPRIQEYWH